MGVVTWFLKRDAFGLSRINRRAFIATFSYSIKISKVLNTLVYAQNNEGRNVLNRIS